MKRSRKILAIMITVCLALSCTVSVSFASPSRSEINKKISIKEKQLEAGKKQEKKLNGQISDIQDNISDLEGDISDLNTQIADTKAKIKKLKKEVKKSKKKLKKGEDDLDSRLRNMYKSGSIGFIDVVLDSGDVTELLSNVEMVKRIYSNDKKTVAALKNQYTKVKTKEKKVEEAEQALEAEQKELKTKKSELSANESELQEKVDAVAASNEELESDLDELNAQSEAIAAKARQAGSSQSTGRNYGGGVMGWPVPSSGSVSSEYGWRFCPVHKCRELHSGMDIPCGYGANVVAANSGTVIEAASMSGGYGNYVMIAHGGGIVTLYGHNSSLCVSAGQSVKRGQTIAKAGSTGASTGVHCHFEVRVNGSPVNPRGYL